MFIVETYRIFDMILFNRELVLAEPQNMETFSIMQSEKHIDLLKNILQKNVLLVIPELSAINRKRLIEKGINFIVPGKHLYLPDLLIDLRENFTHHKATRKKEKLLPSAQLLVIYYILHHDGKWEIEQHSFKEIAEKLGYTAMAITKAIDNLKYHEIIDVSGEKEKFIRFRLSRAEMWQDLEKRHLLISPVLKRVYVDEKPADLVMLRSNESALPEFSDMNPSRQEFYAIEKTAFYGFQKNKVLINLNENEGQYCLEVWKYNPLTLVREMPDKQMVVDPLSLYLSLKDSYDERIQTALEQIIKKYIW
jgi:DNA-binding MarR family transcriptional regulator